MRLFEVVNTGPLDSILRVMQGTVNNPKHPDSMTVRFSALKRMMNSDDYGISTPDSLRQWSEQHPGTIDDAKTFNSGSFDSDPDPLIVLKTTSPGKNPDVPDVTQNTPTVSQMASRAAKKAIST